MTRHLPDPLAATLLCLLTALATVAALTGLARAEETEIATLRVWVDDTDEERWIAPKRGEGPRG